MWKKVMLSCLVCYSLSGYTQYPLSGIYTQDFNSLMSSGTASALPAGWFLLENGTAADAIYSAGTGSGSTGDTYSFGSTGVAERALGTLLSGTLQSTIGFYFTNTTANTITRLIVSYTGEQWRLGAVSRNDRLDFQFSLNSTSLNTGEWVDFDLLDFTAPVSSNPTGALDGNSSINRRAVTATITGVFIAPGSTCFFRWLDTDAPGADDGLAIDDLSIEPGFGTPSTMQYRSAQSGNWSSLSSWEVSADGSNWSAATEIPTWYSNSIRIRNGHSIIHQYFSLVDQLIIESGGQLQHTGGQFTLKDGNGDDLQTENAGIFQLGSSGNLPLWENAGVTIRIKSGGILRISAGGLSTVPGAGIHHAVYIYEHASIVENAYNGMGANGVTYFPNVNSTTIPILRITQPVTLPVGATAITRVNGILEVNGNISFTASGQKIFRNGIRGSASLSTTATCGLIVIDGASAVLGGSGSLNLSASGGLQLGSNTTISLEQDKTIGGQLTLGAVSSYVEAGIYTLTVSGLVNGGGSSSYIRTAGSGSLALENVDVGGKLFPVGHTRYNPVLIEKGSGHRWSVRVNDGITPDFPYTDQGAVLLTWHIRPAVEPPANAADLTFRFDQQTQTGSLFNTTPYSIEPVQAWHRSNGFWLSAGTPQPLVNAGGDIRTVKFSGLMAFGDFGLSRMSLPLPVKLVTFRAMPANDEQVKLYWRIAAAGKTRYLPERSTDNLRFVPLDTVTGDTQTEFEYWDKQPCRGTCYYRLKMIGENGPPTFSEVVLVRAGTGIGIRVRLKENPVTGEAILLFNTDRTEQVKILVTDASGKKILQRKVTIRNGIQSQLLPLTGSGVFYILLETAGWRKRLSLVKQ